MNRGHATGGSAVVTATATVAGAHKGPARTGRAATTYRRSGSTGDEGAGDPGCGAVTQGQPAPKVPGTVRAGLSRLAVGGSQAHTGFCAQQA